MSESNFSPIQKPEHDWQRAPDSRLNYPLDQCFKRKANTGEHIGQFQSPIPSRPSSSFLVQPSASTRNNEPRSSVETETMEVSTPDTVFRNKRQHSYSSSTPSTKTLSLAATDSGSEFENILNVIEDAGFDSVDMMTAQYYSANFRPNSIAQLAQANSRSRDLRQLIQALQKTTPYWSKQETQAYEEEIIQSAKSICLAELSDFREKRAEYSCGPSGEGSPISNSTAKNSDRSSAGTVDKLRHLLLNEEANLPTQQEKRLLRQCVPETWSLLSGLARGSDLPPLQVSQIVYTFLHMITGDMNK